MKRLILILLFLSYTCLSALSQADEYFLKAVFISKIANYIEWPQEKTSNDKYFEIAVYGEDLILKDLNKIYKDYDIKGRKIKVININNIEELSKYNEVEVLFIPKKAELDYEKIKFILENKPVLTISDIDTDLCKKGSIMEFYIRNEKIRLMLNVEALKKTGLNIKPRLINIVKVIEGE